MRSPWSPHPGPGYGPCWHGYGCGLGRRKNLWRHPRPWIGLYPIQLFRMLAVSVWIGRVLNSVHFSYLILLCCAGLRRLGMKLLFNFFKSNKINSLLTSPIGSERSWWSRKKPVYFDPLEILEMLCVLRVYVSSITVKSLNSFLELILPLIWHHDKVCCTKMMMNTVRNSNYYLLYVYTSRVCYKFAHL